MYHTIFPVLLLAASLVDSRSWAPQDEFAAGGGDGRDNDHFAAELLQSHNAYRARHCVSPLSLDGQMSRLAQEHAQQLADSNGRAPALETGFGRNLYTKFSSAFLGDVEGEEVTKDWYKGIRSYDFDHGGFSMQSGSFTQLVWKRSRKLGVGIAYTDGGRAAYVVAYYYPAGNIVDQFERNVLSQC